MNSDIFSKPQQKRKFGFKESREDIKKRLQNEKKEKWKKKISKEDPAKLTIELESFLRASYLSPPQKERKRLVEKMLQEMNSTKERSDTEENKISFITAPPKEEEKENDLALVYANFSEGRNDLFIPRSIRKDEKKQVSGDDLAKIAEKDILKTYDNDDGELDDFLNSL